jgi:hypothetical protein
VQLTVVRLRVGTGALGLIGAAVLVSCGDSSAPLDVNLRISVTTAGVDWDPDGYVVRGESITEAIAAQSSVTVYRSLSPGTYRLEIADLAPNCSVAAPEVEVRVSEDVVAAAEFDVECFAVTGVIRITTATSGRDAPPWYLVSLDPSSAPDFGSQVSPIGSVTLPGIPPGSHEVELRVGANCRTIGPDRQTVTVTIGGLAYDTVSVAFEVECTPRTGDIAVTAETTGPDQNEVGYPIWLDGVKQLEWYFYYYEQPLFLKPNGDLFFPYQTPGDHTVELREIPANCAIQGANPVTVHVIAAALAEARFQIVCTALP